MNNLTTTEQKVLNNLSQEQTKSVKLGDTVQTIIGSLCKFGTPVNALGAQVKLSFSGVVVDGETLTINNPVVPGVDAYEFLADAAQSKTNSTNIAVDITSYTTKAQGSVTLAVQPTSGDKITIGSKTYTFVPVGTDTADGEVSIGTTLDEAHQAFIKAINGTDDINLPHPLVQIVSFVDNVAPIKALVGGVAGNSIVLSCEFTSASNTLSGNHLGTSISGTDCSAENAVTALLATIGNQSAQGVHSSYDGDSTTALYFGAAYKGTIGNNIEVSKTIANAAFENSATKLSGGVDATVSEGIEFMVDATYLYVCIAKNTISDNNWYRIELELVRPPLGP